MSHVRHQGDLDRDILCVIADRWFGHHVHSFTGRFHSAHFLDHHIGGPERSKATPTTKLVDSINGLEVITK